MYYYGGYQGYGCGNPCCGGGYGGGYGYGSGYGASIILVLLIVWGLFDKSKIITDKNGSRFFALIALISVITSCIFYARGYNDSIIVTLIFGFSIIIITLKNFKLISK